MDTTDPTIIFNEKGESDYYTNYVNTIKPNWHTDKKGHAQLMKIAKKIKKDGKNRDFDCIIGFIPYENKADVRFVKYCLETYKLQMQALSKGATQDNLSLEKLRSLNFLIPKIQLYLLSFLNLYF